MLDSRLRRNDRSWDLPFPERLVSKHARGLHKVIEDGFSAGQNLNSSHHAGDNRKRIVLRSEVVLFGPHHDAIEAFGFVIAVLGLFFDDRISANALNFSLERAKD